MDLSDTSTTKYPIQRLTLRMEEDVVSMYHDIFNTVELLLFICDRLQEIID